MLNLHVFTLFMAIYGRKISLRFVQLNVVSLGTKEIFLATVLLCKLACG